MNPYRVILYLEGGLRIETEEPFEFEDADEVQAALEEMLQDREVGPWKQIGHVSFIWKDLRAFEVEAL